MQSTLKPPLIGRINFRVLIFAAVVLALVGWPVYKFLTYSEITQKGDYLEVDLKGISSFPFDQINGTLNDIPAQWRALDGKRVIVYGEMYAGGSAAPEVQTFDLVYSIAKCCFSGPPQIQHFVHSRAINNAPVPFISGLVRATGILHVNVEKADGRVTSVYTLQVESLEPV